MKKTAPLIVGIALIALTSGCVTNSRETGHRTAILDLSPLSPSLGALVDYKRDYQSAGYIYDPADAGLLGTSVVTNKPEGAMAGYSENVYGSKLNVLFGLFKFNWQ